MALKTDKGKNTLPTTSMFKSLFPSYYKVSSLPTGVVTKLKGQENYEERSAYISIMIEAIGAYRNVCKNQTLDEKSDDKEKSLYRVIYS